MPVLGAQFQHVALVGGGLFRDGLLHALLLGAQTFPVIVVVGIIIISMKGAGGGVKLTRFFQNAVRQFALQVGIAALLVIAQQRGVETVRGILFLRLEGRRVIRTPPRVGASLRW